MGLVEDLVILEVEAALHRKFVGSTISLANTVNQLLPQCEKYFASFAIINYLYCCVFNNIYYMDRVLKIQKYGQQ